MEPVHNRPAVAVYFARRAQGLGQRGQPTRLHCCGQGIETLAQRAMECFGIVEERFVERGELARARQARLKRQQAAALNAFRDRCRGLDAIILLDGLAIGLADRGEDPMTGVRVRERNEPKHDVRQPAWREHVHLGQAWWVLQAHGASLPPSDTCGYMHHGTWS